MKAAYLIRNTLLTGVCVGLMTGCSWLDDWPPKGSEMAVKTAPKPPQSKIAQSSEGTWLKPDSTAANVEPKGLNVDDASADRIAKLESSVDELRNDMQMMMPALTKLAEAQGDMQKSLGQVEPAAGTTVPGGAAYNNGNVTGQGNPKPVPITNQQQANSGPQPGSIEWYEQQEKQKRAGNTQQGQQPQTAAQVLQQAQQAQHQQMAQQQSWQQGQPQPRPQPQPQPYQQAYQPAPVPVPQQQYQQNYNQAYNPAQQGMSQYQPQGGYQQASYQQPYQPAPQQQMQGQQQQYQQQPAAMQQASYGGNAYGGGPSVTNIRFGEHPDKTRMVLDTSDKVAFSYNVDNRNRSLTIQLPGTAWQGAKAMDISNSPLVDSYSVMPGQNGGTTLVMQLKQPVQVKWAQSLPPGGPQGNRVVFDLAAM